MSAADINVAFLEVYKKADAFIRDAYGTKDGVTEYLRRMEVVRGGSLACATWDEDYRRLKQARPPKRCNRLIKMKGKTSLRCLAFFVKNLNERR